MDGDGVLRQVLGLGFGVCLEEGLFFKNRGVGFVRDCSYICVIYILAVVCRLVIVANKKKLKTYDIQQKHSDCAYGSAPCGGLLRTGKGHRLFPEQGSGPS